jgi:dephospho-CoA kinase
VERFDQLILVTVPDEVKIARFVARAVNQDGAEADARARLALQIADEEKAARCDFVIDNSGSLPETRVVVEGIYRKLVLMATK